MTTIVTESQKVYTKYKTIYLRNYTTNSADKLNAVI